MAYATDNERRRNLRVDFQTQIILKIDQSEIHMAGSSKDLSLKGIFIHTGEQVPRGTRCQVAVALSGAMQPIDLNMEGVVVRSDDSGLAVAFDSMTLETYTHLKNIVKYNTARPDDVQ